MRVASVFVCALVIAVPAAAMQSPGVLPGLDVCRSAVLVHVAALDGLVSAAQPDPPTSAGSRAFRIPTRTLGRWLHLATGGADTVVTELSEAAGVMRTVHFVAPECRSSEAETREFTIDATAVGHDDLEVRLRQTRAIVVYVWSPHMPLSVDGYDHAAAAASESGLFFLPAVDPHADLGFARRTATERGWPAESARPFSAVELVYRGLTTHSPALTVVGRDWPRDVIFGYRESLAYRAFITRIAPTLPRTP